MAGYLVLAVFLLISTFVILGGGHLAYSYSYLSRLSPSRQLPTWENTMYYTLAIYPVAALIFIYAAGEFFLGDNKVDTIGETRNMLIFCTGHFLLSMQSVSIAQYLQTRHKANVILIITSVIAGGGYLYAGFFAANQLLKQ